jgi:DNA-binding protein H-NS
MPSKWEFSVKGLNLKALSFDSLIDLRNRADRLIRTRASAERRELEKKLAKLTSYAGSLVTRGRKSLKGRKVAPKYRNPANPSETWAGRGARPRWLQALMREGRRLEEFAIGPTARTRPATRRAPRKQSRGKK